MADQSFDKDSDHFEKSSQSESPAIAGSGSILKGRRMSRDQYKENKSPSKKPPGLPKNPNRMTNDIKGLLKDF